MTEYTPYSGELGSDFVGAVLDMPNKEYHAMRSHYSSTNLKYMNSSSPLHFKEKFLSGAPLEELTSDAVVLGSASHSLVLTPDLFAHEFLPMPLCDGRTKEGKKIKSDTLSLAEGRKVISDSIYSKACHISESVLSDAASRKLFDGDFIPEAAFFWKCPFSGLMMRSKLDGIAGNGEYIIELKTTRSAEPSKFERDAYNMGYDLSAFHYLEGVRQSGFENCKDVYIIAVETEAPYAVQCYKASERFLASGNEKWLDAVNKLEQGLNQSIWPGYVNSEIEEYPELNPPRWAKLSEDNSVEDGE